MPPLLPLHDGRPGLRTLLPVEITEIATSQSPTHHSSTLSSEVLLTKEDLSAIAPAKEDLSSEVLLTKEDLSSEVLLTKEDPPLQSSATPTLDFISSDETLDRYDEVISAAGWRLETYQRNPVFQNAHNYGDIIFTLGRALVTEVRSIAGRKALYQRIEFATHINPMARIAYGLYRGKFLNAVSVGFIPIRWQDQDGNNPARHSRRDGEPVLRSASDEVESTIPTPTLRHPVFRSSERRVMSAAARTCSWRAGLKVLGHLGVWG